MLFHVTAQHSWETCRGRMRDEGKLSPAEAAQRQNWIEGNENVKVLAVGGYQSSHRYYAFMEAEDYNSVVLLMHSEKNSKKLFDSAHLDSAGFSSASSVHVYARVRTSIYISPWHPLHCCVI